MWPQFATDDEAAQAYEAYLVSAFAKPYILGDYKCQYRDAVLASGQLKQGLRTVDGELQRIRPAPRGSTRRCWPRYTSPSSTSQPMAWTPIPARWSGLSGPSKRRPRWPR